MECWVSQRKRFSPPNLLLKFHSDWKVHKIFVINIGQYFNNIVMRESWENILDVDDDVHEATHDEAPIGIAQPPKNLSQPIHRFSSLDGYTFFDFYRCFVRFLGVFYFWKPWIIIRTYLPLTSLFLNARGVERNEIDTYRKICGPFWRQKCTTT